MLQELLDGLLAVARLRDDGHVGLQADDPDDAFAHQPMVVDAQDANRGRRHAGERSAAGGDDKRRHGDDGRAVAGLARNPDVAADLLRPLLHVHQTQMRARPGRKTRRHEARAVVGDAQRQRVLAVVERDLDLRRPAVAHGVADRLLADAQQLLFGFRRAAPRLAAAPRRRRPAARPRSDLVRAASSRSASARSRRSSLVERSSMIDSRASRTDRRTSWRSRRSESRGTLLRRVELAGDGLELEPDRAEALEQRVVNLAAHARALGDDERELVLHGAQPQPPRRAERQQQADQADRVEAVGLVERRRDREIPEPRLGPEAVVGRADAEAVTGRAERSRTSPAGAHRRPPTPGLTPSSMYRYRNLMAADRLSVP